MSRSFNWSRKACILSYQLFLFTLVSAGTALAASCPAGTPGGCDFGHPTCGRVSESQAVSGQSRCSISGTVQNTGGVVSSPEIFFSSPGMTCTRVQPTFGVSPSSIPMFTDPEAVDECALIDWELDCTNSSFSEEIVEFTGNDSCFFQITNVDCSPLVYTISGNVRFSDGDPVADAVVNDGSRSDNTAVDGTYTITSVPNGTYTLIGSKPGYLISPLPETNPAKVAGENLINKDFVVSCAANFIRLENECVAVYSISGKVTFEDGTPISNASTSDGNRSVNTAVDGTYLINSVPNGNYTLVSTKPNLVISALPETNPAIVDGADLFDRDFVARCSEAHMQVDGNCLPAPAPEIITEASDGTFPDYVLVNWNPIEEATSYTVYRSDTEGPLGDAISAPINGTSFQDFGAEPGVHYFYTVISDTGISSNQDEGWRPGNTDQCPDGQECIHQELDPFACASANGFLEQVNIASVINSSNETLNFLVEYRDLFGVTQGAVQTAIEPLQKKDFIVNDMGLVVDTYGTVCVSVIDREEQGLWRGGVTLYKADQRDGEASFGDRSDFALYYPFTNPRTGRFTQPLNTFHLGVPSSATIANWVRITDAEPGDGERLQGELRYFDENGKTTHVDIVDLPDGGRFDFSGHEGIAGVDNIDAIGMVRFTPDVKSDGTAAKYYFSLGRYYYDCIGASCNNFFTAFYSAF